MRKPIVLVSLATLAACSGGGPQTVSGSAVGGGSGSTSNHSFVSPTEKKTYSAIGGVQRYSYSTDDRNVAGQYSQLYAGNASTARNSGITISYDPRDAIFELTISDTPSGASDSIRFQDPAHRTDFGGTSEPQDGTPDISGKGIRYLQVGSASGTVRYDLAQSDTFPVGDASGQRNVSTFFYQKPGTSTQYVTYAGFVRNATAIVQVDPPGGGTSYLRQDNILERAAFVFGERTGNSAVPKTGTASYTGDMIATMVYNPLFDDGVADTYYQWILGSGTVNVDFAANSFNSTFTGTVEDPQYDVFTSRTHVLNAGATFNAAGTGTIDLANKGGFSGQMNSASFTQGGSTTAVNIAGSSVDGAFYGPAANEVGGGFRIVGGTPDERIDILGAFTGKKP
jgi:hypothetical protein